MSAASAPSGSPPRSTAERVQGGERWLIHRVEVTLAGGEVIEWSGTGSVMVEHTTVRHGMVTDPEVHYVEALLKFDPPPGPGDLAHRRREADR